jgi:hypothetical protein
VIVYRAYDEQPERDVAINIVPLRMLADGSARRRSREEGPDSKMKDGYLAGLRVDKKTELLVGARGFEPRTPCAQGRCATRLRYAPTLLRP